VKSPPRLARFKERARRADEMEDRSVFGSFGSDGARLHREEVRRMKKLILRVLYSGTTLALIVFALSAGSKHPRGGR
jgi:hypothetical protein